MKNMRMAELLSPAGSFESMKAAVQAGCDAVYIGGARFGARAFAKNADGTALLEAIDYMHIRGKRLYLTVNTLLKEAEFGTLYDDMEPLYRQGLDAAIVQDLGVLRFLHRNFPDLALHASTQMTLTMAEGANLLKGYGVTRLVPARELTLPELIRMRRSTDLEIETFVHGALCYCYSGQCLMSSLLGGRSGNRGRCAQTCRLEYEVCGRKGYLLSMKDMCTLSILPDLMDAGIDSFKIEGRMKREEYVAGVTAVYRKYMDRYEALGREDYLRSLKERPEEFEEDLRRLEELYNRGGFSEGYYRGQKGPSMMAMDRPNHTGIRIGRVEKLSGIRADIRLDLPAREGDVLEIRGGSREYSFTVGGKQLGAGAGKNRLTVNVMPGLGITPGLFVWRTKNETLLRQIRETYLERENQIGIDGRFTARVGEPAELAVSFGKYRVKQTGGTVQAAKSSPVSKERVREQLSKTGGGAFFFQHLTVDCDSDIFLPVKSLNELRREALSGLADAITGSYRRTGRAAGVPEEPAVRREDAAADPDREILVSAVVCHPEQLDAVLGAGAAKVYLDVGCFGLKGALEAAKRIGDDAQCYLRMPQIFRSVAFDIWSDAVLQLADSSVAGFLIRNLEELAFLRMHPELAGKPFGMDDQMYVMNREARRMAEEFGAERWTAPVELNEKELAALNLRGAAAVVYGRLPLMVSSQCVLRNTLGCRPDDHKVITLTDRKGIRFPVIRDCEACCNTILNSVPLSLHDCAEMFRSFGIAEARLDFTVEGAKETKSITEDFLRAYRAGEEVRPVLTGFTRGHLKRGID